MFGFIDKIIQKLIYFFRKVDQRLLKTPLSLRRLIAFNIIIYVSMVIGYLLSLILNVEIVHFALQKITTLPAKFTDWLDRPWTLIVYFFTHDVGDPMHIIVNMLGLYVFGKILVNQLPKKLIITYFLGGIVGGLTFLTAFTFIPYFSEKLTSGLIGASAGVFAVMAACAAVSPNHSFSILFFGRIPLKYIVAIGLLISFVDIGGSNPGGNISHLGGALAGFLYIKLILYRRTYVRKKKFKISYNRIDEIYSDEPTQEQIDAILDKMAEYGYESLTAAEKQKLFNASKRK